MTSDEYQKVVDAIKKALEDTVNNTQDNELAKSGIDAAFDEACRETDQRTLIKTQYHIPEEILSLYPKLCDLVNHLQVVTPYLQTGVGPQHFTPLLGQGVGPQQVPNPYLQTGAGPQHFTPSHGHGISPQQVSGPYLQTGPGPQSH